MVAQTAKTIGKTVRAHHSEATIESGGVLRLTDLPFSAGTIVEVIVLPGLPTSTGSLVALHGTVLKDGSPFAPATPPEDWDALR